MSEKLLEIKNVTAFVSQNKVFERLSIEINSGCSTVILGPNGAGKTTLLKLLAKDIYPLYNEESYIKIFGKENWNIWDLRSKIGIVSNSLNQFIYGNAEGKNVILSGLFASPDLWDYQSVNSSQTDDAEKIMEFLGIAELKDREYECMSTGEQRKFLLGRALINKPDVLILDEPTSGLDVRSCFLYLGIIRDLIKHGKTIILVTHHIHEIPPEIKKVILLKNGKVMLEGEKENIFNNESISNLYDVPLKILQNDGFYNIQPI